MNQYSLKQKIVLSLYLMKNCKVDIQETIPVFLVNQFVSHY
jgi:hypothetical protein